MISTKEGIYVYKNKDTPIALHKLIQRVESTQQIIQQKLCVEGLTILLLAATLGLLVNKITPSRRIKYNGKKTELMLAVMPYLSCDQTKLFPKKRVHWLTPKGNLFNLAWEGLLHALSLTCPLITFMTWPIQKVVVWN